MIVVSRDDVIKALNECIDIKGYAYVSFHDAIMELPFIEIKDGDEDEQD